MVKYLLNFLLIFFMLSSFSFAKKDNSEAKLKKEYGEDLRHVPFFLSFDYYQKYHKDWGKTYYSERKYFLTNYEADLAVEQAKEKAEASAEAAKEKERLYEKKEELRRERDRLKAELEKEKAEKEADAERQKEFNSSINDQQREIQQMQHNVTQEREDPQNNR